MEPIGIKEIVGRLEQSRLKWERNILSPQSSEQIPDCALCADTGYVSTPRGMKECECLREKRVTHQLPPANQKASLLDFNEAIKDFCIDWLGQTRNGLVITGLPGRGKTYLACALVRTLLLIGRTAMFRRCFAFYSDIRQGIHDNVSEDFILEKYVAPRFLFLDDLGAGGLSDFERRMILELLDRRCESLFPTCITTNWSYDDIAEKMDDRIASRLSLFQQLQLEGADRRTERP